MSEDKKKSSSLRAQISTLEAVIEKLKEENEDLRNEKTMELSRYQLAELELEIAQDLAKKLMHKIRILINSQEGEA